MKYMLEHMKEVIGLLIVVSGAALLWYIIINYGQEKEVLFTVLGAASSTLSTVLGAYYTISENRKAKNPPLSPTNVDTVQIEANKAEVSADTVTNTDTSS